MVESFLATDKLVATGFATTDKLIATEFAITDKLVAEGFGATTKAMTEGFAATGKVMVEGFAATDKLIVEGFAAMTPTMAKVNSIYSAIYKTNFLGIPTENYIETIKTDVSSLVKESKTRFNTLSGKIDGVQGTANNIYNELSKGTNSLAVIVSEINANEAKIDTLSKDNATIISKIDAISTKVNTIDATTTSTNTAVSSLVSALGKIEDGDNDGTVFARLNNIRDVSNCILDEQREMQKDIDVILANTSMPKVDEAKKAAVATEVQAYCDSIGGCSGTKHMVDLIVGILQRDEYLK